MGQYTRVSAYIWDWPPFRDSEASTRSVLLGLYTSSVAKRWLPGLMLVSVAELSDTLRIPRLDVQISLSNLVERHIVEHDQGRRVVRLTALPDKAERPANNKVLRMLWGRWCELPESPLKYNHIALLHDLSEPWRTPTIQSTWTATFGGVKFSTITHPVDGRGGSHTVSDTVNHSQPSLFAQESKRYADTVPDTVSIPSGIRNPEYGISERDLPGGSNGHSGSWGQELSTAPSPGPRPPGVPRTGLPPATAFTVADLLGAVAGSSGGRVSCDIVDPRIGDQLWQLVAICTEAQITLADCSTAGAFLGAGYLHYRNDLDARWLAKPGEFLGVVAKSRQWHEAGRPKVNGERTRSGNAAAMLERQRRLAAKEGA